MSNVIKIGDFELEKKTRYSKYLRDKDRCDHKRITMDDQGQTIHCAKCGDQLSSYWVVEEIMDAYLRGLKELKHKKDYTSKINDDLEKEHRFIKVLRKVQSAWRGKNKIAVVCPWCKVGIMPEDGLGDSTIAPHIDFKRMKLVKERNGRSNEVQK